MTSECRLCLQQKELCDSHIVPEFFFTRLYDDAHRFYGLSGVEEERIRIFQKGAREKLLCEGCETKFSVFEHHARSVLYGWPKTLVDDFGGYVVLNGIDYKKFKLFIMSLLWRLGLTSLPCFKGVSLGPRHNERLRRMLVEEDPGEPWEYGCTVTATLHEGQSLDAGVSSPFSGKVRGHWVYKIAAGGFEFAFTVSSHRGSFAELAYLQKNGRLPILRRELTRSRSLMQLASQIMSANKGKQLPGTEI